jgi:hypothetical protein
MKKYKKGQTWCHEDYCITIIGKHKRKSIYAYEDMYGERMYGVTEKQLDDMLKKFELWSD